MGRSDPHAHLDIGPARNERLEHCTVGACDFPSGDRAFGGAGERGRVGRRARMSSMHGEDAEVRNEKHRPGRHQHDEGVQGHQLTAI
jgi:hypothetical protein